MGIWTKFMRFFLSSARKTAIYHFYVCYLVVAIKKNWFHNMHYNYKIQNTILSLCITACRCVYTYIFYFWFLLKAIKFLLLLKFNVFFFWRKKKLLGDLFYTVYIRNRRDAYLNLAKLTQYVAVQCTCILKVCECNAGQL